MVRLVIVGSLLCRLIKVAECIYGSMGLGLPIWMGVDRLSTTPSVSQRRSAMPSPSKTTPSRSSKARSFFPTLSTSTMKYPVHRTRALLPETRRRRKLTHHGSKAFPHATATRLAPPQTSITPFRAALAVLMAATAMPPLLASRRRLHRVSDLCRRRRQ